MAVAVKNSPGAASASPLDRPSVVSLLGALYVLGSLGVVFKGVPALFDLVGLRMVGLGGGILLGLAMMAAAITLLYLGSWLLGSKPTPGVKGGVFIGSVLLVLALLLTRWASLWAEHWAFHGKLPITQGIGLTVAAGVVFLGVLLWAFFHSWTQTQILHLEEMGWFSTTGYKPLQGLRVRRATILGLLLLVGAGVWTLISHGALRRGPSDWRIDVPFTGVVAIDSVGDASQWLETLAPADKPQVRITYPGATGLAPREFVSADSYRKDVTAALSHVSFAGGANKTVSAALDKGEIVGVITAVNGAVHQEIVTVLGLKVFSPEVTRQLRELDQRTSMTDLSPLINEVKRQAQVAGKEKEDELRPIFDLPTAQVVVDRFVLDRLVNPNVDPAKHVRVGLVEEPEFKFRQGEIVPTEDFDAEVARLKKDRKDFIEPKKESLTPASGPATFTSLTLLPAVQYTLPLAMLAGAVWFSWRVVNIPAFADFLIATEAEMNKVSWTTQKRLVQDTIVVLVTVVLMSVYLFGVDQLWRVSLSWKPIGVLVIPKNQSDTNTSVEQKKW